MNKNLKNLQPKSETEEPQRGITIITSGSDKTKAQQPRQNRPEGCSVRDLVGGTLDRLGSLLAAVSNENRFYETDRREFRVPQKIGEADTRPKGKIKLRRVLEY